MKKVPKIIIVIALVVIACIAIRVISHPVYSLNSVELTSHDVERLCPSAVIADEERVLAKEVFEMAELQKIIDENVDVKVIDKAIVEDNVNEAMPDFCIEEVGVMDKSVCIDGYFNSLNDMRYSLTMNNHLILHKVVCDQSTAIRIVYENRNNETYLQHTEKLDIIKSLFS